VRNKYFIYALLFFTITEIKSQSSVGITFIANDGFVMNDGVNKILVDAIFSEGSGMFTTPPAEVLVQERNATSPFDSVDYMLTTHIHADHINVGYVTEHMLNDDSTMLLCPFQVYDSLSHNASFSLIEDRVVSLFPDSAEKIDTSMNGFRFRVVSLIHYNNPQKTVQNLGFIFNLGDICLFHPGDAFFNDTTEVKALDLASDSIEILFLSYRVLDNDFENRGRKIIEYINPKAIILMHIRINEAEEYRERVSELEGLPPIFVTEEQLRTMTFRKSGGNLIIENYTALHQNARDSFTAFPNPAGNYATVQLVNPGKFTSNLELWDLHGNKLVQMKISSSESQVLLNFIPYPKGIYVLKLVSDDSIKTALICHQ